MNKATPQEGNQDRCEHCGQLIYRTQGAEGTTFAHRDSKVIFCTNQGGKVFVVSRDDEEGDHDIIGVFSDEVRAGEVRDAVNKLIGDDPYFHAAVHPHDLDSVTDEWVKAYYGSEGEPVTCEDWCGLHVDHDGPCKER